MPCEYFFSYGWSKEVDGKLQCGLGSVSISHPSLSFGINGMDDIKAAEKLIAEKSDVDRVNVLYWRKF